MSTLALLSIIAGLVAALPFVAVNAAPGGAFLIMFAPLPLFLAGLSQGVIGVAIAGATTMAIVGVMLGFLAALGSFVTLAAPAAILVRQALLNRPLPAGAGQDQGTGGGPAIEWYPPGLLVTWLTGIGVVWLGVALWSIGSGPEGYEARLHAAISEAFGVMLPQAPPEDVSKLADTMAPIAIGAGTLGWLVLWAINATAAQGVLSRAGRNLRPSPEFTQSVLPAWLAPVFAAAMAIALLASGDLAFVAWNLAMVLLFPFLVVGLAVVHVAIRRMQGQLFLFVIFYGVLLFFAWLALLVAALGLLEQWLNLRRRLASAGGSQEE